MVWWSMITAGNITPSRVKNTIFVLTHQGLNGHVIVQRLHIDESLKGNIVNIYLKCKIENLNNQISQIKDDLSFYKRDPFVNLTSWQKGFRTLNDNDQDIIQAYKQGKVSKEAMDKMSISVE